MTITLRIEFMVYNDYKTMESYINIYTVVDFLLSHCLGFTHVDSRKITSMDVIGYMSTFSAIKLHIPVKPLALVSNFLPAWWGVVIQGSKACQSVIHTKVLLRVFPQLWPAQFHLVFLRSLWVLILLLSRLSFINLDFELPKWSPTTRSHCESPTDSTFTLWKCFSETLALVPQSIFWVYTCHYPS